MIPTHCTFINQLGVGVLLLLSCISFNVNHSHTTIPARVTSIVVLLEKEALKMNIAKDY